MTKEIIEEKFKETLKVVNELKEQNELVKKHSQLVDFLYSEENFKARISEMLKYFILVRYFFLRNWNKRTWSHERFNCSIQLNSDNWLKQIFLAQTILAAWLYNWKLLTEDQKQAYKEKWQDRDLIDNDEINEVVALLMEETYEFYESLQMYFETLHLRYYKDLKKEYVKKNNFITEEIRKHFAKEKETFNEVSKLDNSDEYSTLYSILLNEIFSEVNHLVEYKSLAKILDEQNLIKKEYLELNPELLKIVVMHNWIEFLLN